MRIIQNERFISPRRAIGKYLPWAALLVLFSGLILSFAKPELLLVMLGSVVLGLIFSMVGGYFAERYAGPVAHHEALARALKGLDNHHVLVQYTLPVSHVLLDPGGCTLFVVKSQAGTIQYEDGRWNHKQRGKVFRQMAGQENVGFPHVEAEHGVQRLEGWLARELPGVDVPVQAAIVFVQPKITLDAKHSPVPALHVKKVKAWLRGPGRRKPLPAYVYRQLASALTGDTPQDA